MISSRYLDVPARNGPEDTPLLDPYYIMGGDRRRRRDKKQGQSTSSNSCNGHSNVYERLITRSPCFSPSTLSSNSCNGHSNLYEKLISRSACFSRSEVTKFRRRGLTLLHLAAREEGIALYIAQAVLTCGCIPINSQTLDDGRTPLFIASNYGQVNMVKLFLEQEGINVNIREKIYTNKSDSAGNTPLYAAAREGHARSSKDPAWLCRNRY